MCKRINDISSTNTYFGYLSKTCERGYTQGNPILPYLLILCVELLSLAVKSRKEGNVLFNDALNTF